jgi:hypothetical protein
MAMGHHRYMALLMGGNPSMFFNHLKTQNNIVMNSNFKPLLIHGLVQNLMIWMQILSKQSIWKIKLIMLVTCQAFKVMEAWESTFKQQNLVLLVCQ